VLHDDAAIVAVVVVVEGCGCSSCLEKERKENNRSTQLPYTILNVDMERTRIES